MRSVNVTITGQVWIDEQEIERLMQEEGMTETKAIEWHAMEKAMNSVESDNMMKVRDTIVLLHSLSSND